MVEWCYLGRRRFTEPFFESTLQHCMRMPFNMLFRRQTPVETLLECQATRPGLRPTGFIFHMSRCGSTLVSQMLAALPQNIVLSEASPIDEVLTAIRVAQPMPDTRHIEWLRAMVSALGQRRYPDECRLFIKFDCWHTQDLPLLRAAFPKTPWIFVYRDPLEVMASQMRTRGIHLVPSPINCVRFGIDPSEAAQLTHEEYAARVLAAVLQAALDQESESGGGLLVNYLQLPQAVTTSIAAHFGVSWTAAETERMQRVAQFDAKNPCLYFTADQEEKQRAITPAIASAKERWLTPLYARLEVLREQAEKNSSGP
jgi:hypothetical protein